MSDCRQRLVKRGDDVVDVFEANGEANQLRRNAALAQILVGELRVGGRGRMDDEALRVADVGEDREDVAVRRIRDLARLLRTALHAKDDHAARAVRQVLRRQLRLRERGILHPRDLRMALEVLGDGERILAVAGDAERQRLHALKEDPRRIRREGRTLVADAHREKADRKRDRLERIGQVVREAETVVAGVRLVVERELGIAPVEAAFLHDDAADAGAVSADPLRKRVNHEVGAMVERAEKRRRGERGVHHERQMMPVRDLRVLLDVGDVKGGVADGFNEEKPSLLVDRRFDGPKIVHRREAHLDADVRQNGVELAEGAAVEIVRRHDLVARAGDVRDGEVDRRRAAGERLRRRAAFKGGDPLGEDVVRGVHQPGIDVAEFAQGEEVGAVLGVAEVVRRGAIDRHGPRVRGGVAVCILSGVDRQRFDMVFSVAHVDCSFCSLKTPHIVSHRRAIA